MRTISISGFGGSYEWGCQRMLELGIEWLKNHPAFDFSVYDTFKNVYGVVMTEDKAAKELDRVLTSGDPKLKEYGVTGAMHQAVVSHLAYIHEHGHDKWLAEAAKHRSVGDFFDFDGAESSCPPDSVGPRKTLDQMFCSCGHKFIQHALTLDEAALKFAEGDFTAPCKAEDCMCQSYRDECGLVQ